MKPSTTKRAAVLTKKTSIQLQSPVRRSQLSPVRVQDKARLPEKQLTSRTQKTKGANIIVIKEIKDSKQFGRTVQPPIADPGRPTSLKPFRDGRPKDQKTIIKTNEAGRKSDIVKTPS